MTKAGAKTFGMLVAGFVILCAGATIFGTASQARTTPAPATRPVVVGAMEVYPGAIELTGARASQSIVATVTQGNGIMQDVTGGAKITVDDAKIARIEGHSVLPVADGKTLIHMKSAAGECVIPVTVKNAAVNAPISFKLDVMPVFMRSGCNVGSCHGSARGKDGISAVAVRVRSGRRLQPDHA